MKIKTIPAGTWEMDYSVELVSTLNSHQAAGLLYGIMKGVEIDRWTLYKPKDLQVLIDYPLNNGIVMPVPAESIAYPYSSLKDWIPGAIRIASLGMLLLVIAEKYQEIYQDPHRYGVWGHGLEDLHFERVTVGQAGNVELFVGS